MDSKTFVALFEEQFATCDTMLNKTKREEYAAGGDVLHNFKQAAHLEQSTMRQALGGVLVKHIVSIFDMIHEPESRDQAVWDEKINDTINYMILLKAIVIEEKLMDEAISSMKSDLQRVPAPAATVHPFQKSPSGPTGTSEVKPDDPDKDS